MGNCPTRRRCSIPPDTPLGERLAQWDRLREASLSSAKMIKLCTKKWPLLPLEGGQRWPTYGSLDEQLILQLLAKLSKEGRERDLAYATSFLLLSRGRDIGKTGVRVPTCKEPGNPANFPKGSLTDPLLAREEDPILETLSNPPPFRPPAPTCAARRTHAPAPRSPVLRTPPPSPKPSTCLLSSLGRVCSDPCHAFPCTISSCSPLLITPSHFSFALSSLSFSAKCFTTWTPYPS